MAKKILRWFLSNLLVILVVISVIYSYIYWGNLTGGDTPAGKGVAFLSQKFEGVDNFVEGVKNKQARLAGTQIGEQLVKETSDEVSLAEIPADDSSTNAQASLQQETTSLAVADENTVIEKREAADTQNIPQSDFNVDGPESVIADSSQPGSDVINETIADEAVKTEAISDADKIELSNEQTTSEQETTEAGDSKLVVSEQTETNLPDIETSQQPASITYGQNNTQVKQTSEGAVESQSQEQASPESAESLLTPELAVDEQLESERESSGGGFVSAGVVDQVENVQVESVKEEGSAVKENTPSAEVLSTAQPLVVQMPTEKPEMSIQDTWVLARKAFYQKQYDLSEQSYQKVIAATKDNFDAYGELGNVYFSQGKKSQAADAYLRSATILFTKGDNKRAQSLLQVLQQLDSSKASQLQHLMDVPSL